MADVGHPLQLGLFRRGNPLRGQKKNRSLAEKLEAARETWAALGSFASLWMTLPEINAFHFTETRGFVKRAGL
jgi:hypothetical protein